MPLVIPDETLQLAGMDEREAKIEIACRLFDAGKLTIGHAARLADLSVAEFEQQLACGVCLVTGTPKTCLRIMWKLSRNSDGGRCMPGNPD
jgi:hypothetical protein